MDVAGQQVRLRETELPVPVRLESLPASFAQKVAWRWVQDHPGVDAIYRQTVRGANLEVNGDAGPTILRQVTLTDDDVVWYLKETNQSPHLAPLLGGNLDLIPQARLAMPHWDYFLKSVESGERMRKPVSVVQPCIQLAIHNFQDSFAPELVRYVVDHTPAYGPWLEQHVTVFYDLLNQTGVR